jgi:CTP:molybdopterin cytidylyltransferase MocA
LLQRQLEFLGECLPTAAVAVSIQADWADRCRALSVGVRWVKVDPEAPALASVLALSSSLPMDRWTFLFHVDMRVWEPGLFELLAQGIPDAEGQGLEAFVPTHAGKRGHPVLLSPVLKVPLAELDPARDRLDLWLRSRRVREVAVSYPCIRDNWNF